MFQVDGANVNRGRKAGAAFKTLRQPLRSKTHEFNDAGRMPGISRMAARKKIGSPVDVRQNPPAPAGFLMLLLAILGDQGGNMSANTPTPPQVESSPEPAGLGTPGSAPPPTPMPATPSIDVPVGQAGTQTSESPAIVQQNNLPASPSNNRPGYRFTSVELTEEEFHTPGVHKVMFQDMLRLEGEVNDLKELRQKYATECTASAVLREQLTAAKSVDVVKQNARTIADICLAIAMAAAGYFLSHADTLTDGKQQTKFVLLAVAACALAIVVKGKAK